MINQNLPIEDKIRAAVHSVEPDRKFSDALWNQIAETPRFTPWYAPFQAIFARPALNAALSLAVVVVGIAAVGPQNVAAAFNNLIAYLPGVGFVQDDGKTFYLPQAVSVEKDGVKLTVEQGMADAEQTVVAYHIDGLPEVKPGEVVACVYHDVTLRDNNGKTLRPMGGGSQGSQARIEFFPLPEGEKKATLLVALSQEDSKACTAPANWSVDLNFSSTSPSTPLLPVAVGEEVQLPEPTAAAPAAAAAKPAEAKMGSEIKFVFEKVATLSDGYLVSGHIQWENKAWELVGMDHEGLQVVDATGKNVPIEPPADGWQDNEFAFKITGRGFQSPLTLKVSSVFVRPTVDKKYAFSFDAGASPKVGQSWDINQDLDVAGYPIHVGNVKVVHHDAAPNENSAADGYAIEVQNIPPVGNVDFFCRGKENTAAGLGGWGQAKNIGESGKLLESYYPDGLPTGQVTCQVHNMNFPLKGAWQFQWQLPK